MEKLKIHRPREENSGSLHRGQRKFQFADREGEKGLSVWKPNKARSQRRLTNAIGELFLTVGAGGTSSDLRCSQGFGKLQLGGKSLPGVERK